MKNFAELGLEGPVLNALKEAGFDKPKPIQADTIPYQLAGRDILGLAETGSGKTAAFGLPLVAMLNKDTDRKPRHVKALILAPTRELACQIEEQIRLFARGSHIKTTLLLGGVSKNPQIRSLAGGTDICISTPGRLRDLMQTGHAILSDAKWLVLDEADRMLDMGFIPDVKFICKALHPKRQTALFSATMPKEIEKLVSALLKDPVRVETERHGSTVATVSQQLVRLQKGAKRKVLEKILAGDAVRNAIVFARTKRGANRVFQNLEAHGVSAAVIHGNKSQNARQSALRGFKEGRVRVLVATDVAARGVDIPGVSHVINYELPDEPESYVHRIGRTGRNGASGIAITLCDDGENQKLRAIERLIRKPIAVNQDIEVPEIAPTVARSPWNASAHAEGEDEPDRQKPRNGQGRGKGRPGQRSAGAGSGAPGKRNGTGNRFKVAGENAGEGGERSHRRSSGRPASAGPAKSGRPSRPAAGGGGKPGGANRNRRRTRPGAGASA